MKEGEGSRAATGIQGLDQVLRGGFPRDESYLVRGRPGTGKTLLGLHFLLAGGAQGETGLFLTLSQRASSLRRQAESHGWSLDGIHVHDVIASLESRRAGAEQVLFHTSDIELGETTREILETVERLAPSRVVIDTVSDLRLLAEHPARYRRQLLAIRSFFSDQQATVLFLEDQAAGSSDNELPSMAHGVIDLEQSLTPLGNERRRLRAVKLRGSSYHEGVHDFDIRTGGLVVYPRLETEERELTRPREELSSGRSEIDELTGGGLLAGTSCLLMGPSGTGKSSLATLYAHSAAERGQPAAIFLFEETAHTFLERAQQLGVPLDEHLSTGRLVLRQIRTGGLSQGELVHDVRRLVEEHKIRLLVLDSLTGYMNAVEGDHLVVAQIHDLLCYLSGRGVLSLLVVAQHGGVGQQIEDPLDVSYLSDTVLLLRHFEHEGVIRKALSVFKKRYGDHEKRIREVMIGPGGIRIGDPISQLSGTLTGAPTWLGEPRALLEQVAGEES